MTEIEKLVQGMHDSVCMCRGWCRWAASDYEAFLSWVQAHWGSYYPLEDYLIRMRNANSTSE